MGRQGKAPNFAYVGESTRPECLIVGVYENSIRRIMELPANTSTSAVVEYKRGQVFVRNAVGAITPLTVVEVTAEAVGTGDGEVKVFNLDHFPMIASSLVVKAAGTAVLATAYTLDPLTGVVTFAEAPANLAAITADYDYLSHTPTDFLKVVPVIIEWDVTVPKKVASTNGTGTASVVLKGEIASDQLLIGTVKWEDLDADAKIQVENMLTISGLVPGVVVR